MSTLLEAAEGLVLDAADVAEAAVYGARIALTTVVNRQLLEKGWTRSRLAAEMQVSPGRVSQILNTETSVSYANVVKMLHVVGIDMSDCLHSASAVNEA